jgi:Protein of unknown function DUF58
MKEAYKRLDIQTKKLASSIFLWNYKTAFQGRGMEFRDFQEYSYGEDAKDIDWLVSAREWKTLFRRYQEERQLDILFVFDITLSLSFGTQKTVLDLMQGLFFLLWYSAISNGDRIGAFFLQTDNSVHIPPAGWQKSMFHIFQNFPLDVSALKQTPVFSFSPLLKQKVQKKLLFILSDRFDFDMREFKLIALQNDVILFHLSDVFADTLEWTGIAYLSSPSQQYGISLDDMSKKTAYKTLRIQKKKLLSQSLSEIGVETVFLNTKSNVFYEIFTFMKKREAR